MTVPRFSKEIYVFFLNVKKNILTKLFGLLCDYMSLTISIAAIGCTRNIIFKIYQRRAVRLFAYSQNLINRQEEAVQRLKPLLTCDMRDQCLFFTQVTKDMEQEGTRSARTWIHYRPPLLTLRGQPVTSGTEYLSLSFSVYLLISYLATYFSRLFPKQPQQLEQNCFMLGSRSSTNMLCPLIVERLLPLGNCSDIRQRLLHLKTWATAPPLGWAIRYIPVPQPQLVAPNRENTNPEKWVSKEVGWGQLAGRMASWHQNVSQWLWKVLTMVLTKAACRDDLCLKYKAEHSSC